MIAFVLAGIARCASATACPTDDQLLAAVWTDSLTSSQQTVMAAEARGDIVLVHPRRPLRVRKVVCGEPTGDGDAVTLGCAFELQFVHGVDHRVTYLARAGSGWAITRSLGIWRAER